MSEEEFILKYFNREFPNDHPIVYLYTLGSHKSSTNAIDKGVAIVSIVFSPVYPIFYLKELLTSFLEYKKDQYFKGEIQIKPIY